MARSGDRPQPVYKLRLPKRFKFTGSGKILRMKQGRNHLKRRKSKRSRRSMRKYHSVSKADRKKVRRLLRR